MSTPVGPRTPIEATPELHWLVYDPTIPGNAQIEKVVLNAQAGMRFAEAIAAAEAWPEVEMPEDIATEEFVQTYVDEQLQAIIDGLDAIMNP